MFCLDETMKPVVKRKRLSSSKCYLMLTLSPSIHCTISTSTTTAVISQSVLMHQMFLYFQSHPKCLTSKKLCLCVTQKGFCIPASRGFFLTRHLAYMKHKAKGPRSVGLCVEGRLLSDSVLC